MPIARVCSLRPAMGAAVGMGAGAAGVRHAAVGTAAEAEDAGAAVRVGVVVEVAVGAVAAVAVFGLDLSGSASTPFRHTAYTRVWFADADTAFAHMRANAHFGKIVLSL